MATCKCMQMTAESCAMYVHHYMYAHRLYMFAHVRRNKGGEAPNHYMPTFASTASDALRITLTP